MRLDDRRDEELRHVEILPDVNPYAEGSCLVKFGNTHVLCTASVTTEIEPWLKNEDHGWITAEYALLPRSTKTRVKRETGQVKGRTHEIQRLIGRSLRAVVDLKVLKGYTVIVDCDVLQADGGTRTASVTGGFVALYRAMQKMQKDGLISKFPVKEFVAAISCGISGDKVLMDLNYEEDSNALVDANFVLTESCGIVEIQATAEKEIFLAGQFSLLFNMARNGVRQLIKKQKKALGVKS